MKLAEPVDVTTEALQAIRKRHTLQFDPARPLPSAGIINSVIGLGDEYVLRVPRAGQSHVEQALTEAAVIPVASAAGLRTARLVAFDDTCDILPVLYLIVERLQGSTLESLDLVPPRPGGVWRELGRDLALLHCGAQPPRLVHAQKSALEEFGDPRGLVEARAADGLISTLEARAVRVA